MKRLGVDVGGVIISRANDKTDTSFFSDRYLETPPSTGAFDVLNKLGKEWEIHIVSKCGSKIRAKTLEWFIHQDFYETAGVNPQNVHFCKTRPEKAPICQELGIEAFIDDRLDILASMVGIVPIRILFQPSEEILNNPVGSLTGITIANKWEDIPMCLGE